MCPRDHTIMNVSKVVFLKVLLLAIQKFIYFLFKISNRRFEVCRKQYWEGRRHVTLYVDLVFWRLIMLIILRHSCICDVNTRKVFMHNYVVFLKLSLRMFAHMQITCLSLQIGMNLKNKCM